MVFRILNSSFFLFILTDMTVKVKGLSLEFGLMDQYVNSKNRKNIIFQHLFSLDNHVVTVKIFIY